MSLNLDARQRAMLAHMGVATWLLPALPDEQAAQPANARPVQHAAAQGSDRGPSMATGQAQPPSPIASPHPQTRQPVAREPSGQGARVSIASAPQAAAVPGGWVGLLAEVNACQACAMCQGRQGVVMTPLSEPPRADWMVIGEPPDDEQERAGMPFAGEAGALLDKMLKAVGANRLGHPLHAQSQRVEPAAKAYLSLVLKCRPAVPVAPDEQALDACAVHLQREIALVQPKVILAMGRLAMRVLLSQSQDNALRLPLAKLRGRLWQYQGVPVVVTYPPAYLLRNPDDKAKAWEDLKLAREVVLGGASKA